MKDLSVSDSCVFPPGRVAVGSKRGRNGVQHDGARVEGRELRRRGAVGVEDVLFHVVLAPAVCLLVVVAHGLRVPGDAGRRRLVLVDAAQRVTELVGDDARELGLGRRVFQPAKVHGVLVSMDGQVVGTYVRPRQAARVDVHADLGVARVDKGTEAPYKSS